MTSRSLQKFEEAVARNISAGVILVRYDIYFRVEDAVDIRFWESLLAPHTKGKKVKYLSFVQSGGKHITGKSYILKQIAMASPNYIMCVDSDLDYLMQKKDFDAQHYILQTYTYSWENHHCWHVNLQSTWVKWQKEMEFDFTIFLPSLAEILYDALVLLMTKKRLKHRGLTLTQLCNVIDKIQGNRKELLKDNGIPLLREVKTNICALINNVYSEDELELSKTRQHFSLLGVVPANAYLYMQGHSVYNLICRIGRTLMNDDSFENQVLIPSFSRTAVYPELLKVQKDICYLMKYVKVNTIPCNDYREHITG